MKLHELTIHKAHELLKQKKISSAELTRAVLDRIETMDERVGAYITVAGDTAMKQAQLADKAISNGKCRPLTGIPLAIKDLICTKGLQTTCASKILENFIPQYNATAIKKLNDQGAIIIGKTNMDEFAMGSSTEHSGLKLTCNPWNLSHIPGGSSGGSAAAVAADMCLGALGSDTGGSIRQPASHCSVTGLKPTYGRVSRFGLVAFASSLDQIGPLAKDVIDCAILLNTVSGYDHNDSTSVPEDVPDYTSFLKNSLKKGLEGITVGIVREYGEAKGLDNDVSDAVNNAITMIENLGAKCIEVTLPHTEYAVAAYYVIAPAEASSNLARYDGVKYGFRDTDKTELMDMYKSTRSQGFGSEAVFYTVIPGILCDCTGRGEFKSCQV